MTAPVEIVEKLAQGRDFNLRKSDFSTTKTSFSAKNFTVFEVESKKEFIWTQDGKKENEEWKPSTVIRSTKLPNNEEQIKALFDQFEVRKSIDYEKCSSLLAFHEQGIIKFNDELYHITRYDQPFRDIGFWINVDYQGIEIENLDVFRLARGCLEVLEYLETNGYVLTQFDEHNIYATSLSEARANFFKVMFKGHKDKNAPFTALQKRHRFSPPETESKDIYKSYSFSLGLILIWTIYATNKNEEQFPKAVHSNPSVIPDIIQYAVNTLYKSQNLELKDLFKIFLEELLQVDIAKRRSAKELLTFKWIIEGDKLDYQEYQKECSEFELTLSNEKKLNENNF